MDRRAAGRLGALAILIGLVASAACGGGNDCKSRCDQAKQDGCIDRSANCDMVCMEAEGLWALVRGQADRTRCRTPFDNLYNCQWSGSICNAEMRCSSQAEAYRACVAEYCMANPTSPDCSGM